MIPVVYYTKEQDIFPWKRSNKERVRYSQGVYTLIIFLSEEKCLCIGKLGRYRFKNGYYTYTGSGLGKGASSLSHRISRHLQREKPKNWHIDFLLAHAEVIAVIAAQTNRKLECKINRYIKLKGDAEVPVIGFGASDCKENCESHLLFFGEKNVEVKIVEFYAEKLRLEILHLRKPQEARLCRTTRQLMQ